MIKETLIAISLFANVSLSSLGVTPSASMAAEKQIMAYEELDLTNRIPNYPDGNQIFADNILLSLHYLKGDVEEFRVSEEIASSSFDKLRISRNDDKTINGPKNIDWEKVRTPFDVSFTLKSGEVFAYHNNVLEEYKGKVSYSMNSRFYVEEGYKSLNGLGGNGVCHLASLINWVSKDGGLEVVSHVNHDFSPVNGVPREYGSSIFYAPSGQNSQEQNLYIKNNLDYPIRFDFKVDEKKVALSISKISND
ncbi:MAG: VanW family protein [Candidatus Levybacteria bacterium]|nr:VanW family protein [Candidatus Levybacteria bacterium]